MKELEVHKIGEHGAVMFAGQKEDICAECGKPVFKEVNPLKRSCYIKLCDKGFEDAADKIEELVREVNKLKIKYQSA